MNMMMLIPKLTDKELRFCEWAWYDAIWGRIGVPAEASPHKLMLISREQLLKKITRMGPYTESWVPTVRELVEKLKDEHSETHR